MQNLKEIAEKFNIEGDILEISPLSGGLINSTYLLKTKENQPNYIFQKKNKDIFKNVPLMMDNIVKVTDHIRKKIKEEGGDTKREVMTIVNTKDGKPYVTDNNGDYWTMSVFIPDSINFDKADKPELAFKGGEGIGKFHLQLADFTTPLHEIIPGFHNLKYRFNQWDETIKKDPVGRVRELGREIEWIEKRRDEMMNFWNLVENGTIPKRVTHNDTKISNILFDKNGKLLCVIDLDTVMSNTLLADYGDAIRTFANTSVEDDRNPDNVGLNKEMFKAYTEGYLGQTRNILTEAELEYLPFGARYITFEQTLRFLMDYIDGDKYYKILYPEHNLVRTVAQQRLLESMENNYDFMKKI